jgi:hypothetical protein
MIRARCDSACAVLGRAASTLNSDCSAEVTSRPDATIAELRAWLFETHKVSASTGLMWKTLAALDLTLKTYGPPRRQVVFVIQSDQSTPTYPVSGHRPGQDGDSHVPVLIKLTASSAIF